MTTLGVNVVLAYESTLALSVLMQCARVSHEHVMQVFSGKRRGIARLYRGCRSVMVAASMLSHEGRGHGRTGVFRAERRHAAGSVSDRRLRRSGGCAGGGGTLRPAADCRRSSHRVEGASLTLG